MITPPKTNDYRLSGNVQNILLVGALSLLRDRPKLRLAAGVLGFLLLMIGAFSYVLPDSYFTRLSTPVLISGFALLLVSTLARPEFNVYIGEPVEVVERREAEAQESGSKDPYAALDLATKRLNEYYAINQSQARGSFRWAVFAMFCGFSTIVAGVWLFYLGEHPDVFLTSLSTAAGIVVNVVSTLYLYLHNKTQRRSLYYYNQLVRLQQLGLLIRMAESHTESTDKAAAKNKVIDEVLQVIKSAADKDATAVLDESK